MVKCKVCKREFRNARGLKRHMHIHAEPVDPVDAIGDPAPEASSPDPVEPIEELRGSKEISRLDVLKLDAERLADQNGHALDPWNEYDRWADCKCRLCGKTAAAALSPAAGLPYVSGSATTSPCG